MPSGGQDDVVATFTTGAVGSGTLIVTASGFGVSDQGSYSISIAYDVAVTPDGQATPQRRNNTGGYTADFTVQNTGTLPNTYSVSCGGSNVTCTALSPTSVPLGAGASAIVTATYSVGSPTSGTLTLSASGSGAIDGGSFTVPIASWSVAVTPDGTATPQRRENTGGYTATFTVQNSGTAQDTYSLTCGGAPNVTCNGLTIGGSAATSVTLVGNTSATVVASYNVGNRGSGTLSLTATGTTAPVGAQAIDGGSFSVTVDGWTVAVTPDGTTTPERLPNTAGLTASFTVQNTGTVADTYNLVCSSSSNITCISSSATSLPLQPQASGVVTITYNTRAVGNATLTLTATGTTAPVGAQATDPGSYQVPVVTYGVAVSPHGGFTGKAPATSTSQSFSVQNTGSVRKTYNLSISCTATVSVCTGPSSITVDPGVTGTAAVAYQSGTAGTVGTVKLTAAQSDVTTVRDSGLVTISAGNTDSSTVDVNRVNSGAVVERDLCLTISLGGGGAIECGDLRLAQALPSTRTLNRGRTPTLLYNSAHARPYPLTAANVTLPVTAMWPDSVVATLRFGTIPKGRGKWIGSDWVAGATRRVVVGYDGISDTTGIYSFTFELVNWYPGPTSRVTTVSGQVIIVNRKDSPFGAGWWLAGLERLNVGDMRWVGGDGSVRQYQAVAANLWAAPNVDRPDTLKFDGTNYARIAPHGVRVKFDAQGRHVQTVNRLGQVTSFGYDGCGRLSTITLPPAAAARVYQFSYASATDCATRLASVAAPPAGPQSRITTITPVGGRISTIRDPDNTTVIFGYSIIDTSVIASRTDRRGVVTSFGFDPAKKVAQALLVPGSGEQTILTNFLALESRGLASAVDTALAYSRLDGPRTDVPDTTAFWLDRYGAPRKIVNALGFATVLTRGDPRWPALVTELRSPNGLVTQAAYDARGNVDTSLVLNGLGDGRNALTRYEWDPTWDFVTKIVPPERDSIVFAYSDTNGNRRYQQDARGTIGRTEFFYYATGVEAGLLRSLRTPGQMLSDPRDSIVYDGVVGNLFKTKTPLGFWTVQYTDGVGRDTLVVTPTDSAQTVAYQQRQRVLYDIADQDTLTMSLGPALPYRRTPAGDSTLTPAETLLVRKYFNAEGGLDSLRRRARPNVAGLDTLMTTRYRYDGAGRRIAEVSPDGKRDSTFYDPAGNAIVQVTRLGDTLRLTYDALNRLSQRVTPAKTYAYQAATGSTTWHFPMYRADASGELNTLNGGSGGTLGLTIASDTAAFTYDSLSNIRSANDRDAQITRTYNPNGALATETQRIRTYVGSDFTQHAYQLRYGYDLNGRRIQLYHPANLAPAPGGVPVTAPVTYHYNTIGQLDTIMDVFGGRYPLVYDLDGRLTQVRGEQRFYDADGRLTRREDGYHSDTLRYDARGKVLRAGTRADSTHTRYFGLGAVAWSQTREYYDQSTHPEEQYVSDALGNLAHVYRRVNGTRIVETPRDTRYAYDPASARLLQLAVGDSANPNYADDVSSSGYDLAGNQRIRNRDVITTFNSNPATLSERTVDYYAADGKLRVADRRTCIFDPNSVCQTGWGTDFNDRQAFEEYRYDALGRRVLLRSRGEWGCLGDGCRKLLQRFVWDGDQLLYEISSPGGTGETAANMERDVNQPLPAQGVNQSGFPTSSYYYTGRVAYTHGLGLDAPLGVIRMEYSQLFADPFVVAPVTTWRGDYDNGSGLPCQSQTGVNPNDLTRDTVYTFCVEVQWPAPYLWVTKLARQRNIGPVSWIGSLIENKRDLTGQLYMRNRYYDPASGRFTQEDPIGLAGGLNLYGFANGDPVNFSDPFGLRVDVTNERLKDLLRRLIQASPTFARIFRGLHLASEVLVDVQACSDVGPGCPSRYNLEINKGHTDCYATATTRCTVYIFDEGSSDDLVSSLLGHELSHAAAAAGDKAATGVSCVQGEDPEACAGRVQKQIEDEQRKARAKKRNPNDTGGTDQP